MTDDQLSLQERYASHTICFGCGPANPNGLHVRSFPAAEGEVIADWTPAGHHQAFPGVLNGGIIGVLMDCHSNWTAAWHLMAQRGAERPPTTVTADYHVHMRRPTPTDAALRLRAKVVESTGDRATVEATLESGGQVTATCRGTFVAVKPGHPAYERW
jgi:acyl-coenzyme A thioesterase PaaI-like protein